MNEMVENKGCLKGYIGGRKLRLASLLSIISTAISAILFMALPASAASFSQQDLFKRAFSSTAYIMTMAERDPGFMASLSANEKLMLKKVTIVAQRARNFEWLKQNGVYISPEGRSYTVVKKYDYQRSFEESEYEEAFVIETRVRAELAFSSDQSLFDLKPGEAIRTAVTGDDPHAPIFVNTEIINSPKNRIGFSEAVQLLIHEFGHKLVKEKLQNEVDTLAAKVKSFIDSKMTTSRISNGQVHALRFETSFYPEWQENAIQGTYVGVNIPPRFDEFRAVSGEGIYVFLENESGTVDISTGLHNDIIKASTFNPYAGLAYDWRHMRFFTSRAIRVRETEAGKVRIEMEMEQAQTALPFLKPGVPDPRA
ncbi:MAG: hypothetical protein V4692_12030, partial [Bdellovibrionota bacterium]